MSRLNFHDGDRFCSEPPLPLRLLRRLIVGGKHTIGEHVLIAGAHCTAIAEWLDELGFDVDVVDDEPNRISAKLKRTSRFEIHCASLDSQSISWDDSFDLVIADELQMYRENLLTLKARTATAELLSVLRPGGEIVIVREPVDHNQHDAACWTRHLACFPGRLETVEYSSSFFSHKTLTRLFRRVRHDSFLTVSLRTPAEKISRLEWMQNARQGSSTISDACCLPPAATQQRRAA